jgi:protein-S-isoprenylcysteine O-methyltransferase Ste14
MGTETILDWIWGALGVYWLVSARGTKEAVTGEASWWRVIRLSILAAGFILLLSPWLRYGLLARRFLPENLFLSELGIALTFAGVLLCVWARVCLGEYWSDKVVLKADHELIRSGPYAYLRHPIYSGVLLGIVGTALVVGEWRGIVTLVLMGANYFVKARREERMLAGSFGEAYAEYKRRTGFFLPGL